MTWLATWSRLRDWIWLAAAAAAKNVTGGGA